MFNDSENNYIKDAFSRVIVDYIKFSLIYSAGRMRQQRLDLYLHIASSSIPHKDSSPMLAKMILV